MRRLLLSVSLSALLVAACGGAASTLPPDRDTGQHHQPPPVDPFPTRPYDGVTFEDPGANPYVDPVEDRESTFALDVDTAAYGIARRFVADGYRPDPASVRVEEYVNAFAGGYPEPRDGTFAIHVDGAPSPFLPPDEVLLRIGIKAAGGHELERPPAALTFVIDTSGSMAREERLELVKDALGVLVDNLAPADSVAIVTFGSDAGIALGPTPATDGHRILDARSPACVPTAPRTSNTVSGCVMSSPDRR